MKSAQHYKVPVDTLLARLEIFQTATERVLDQFDIGEFPECTLATSQSLPELDPMVGFLFLKWLYRSDSSDVAPVKLYVLSIHETSAC